ncbi:hypothetical protein [Amycolatopsis sp. NPDC004079]|uniref:NucA/NucB deoxyribonuclease domain-containing protein n=1 Tax=Amycolatopsis sp. NPDC004079 TaxID=3154549 RepID=UPI0033ACCF2E
MIGLCQACVPRCGTGEAVPRGPLPPRKPRVRRRAGLESADVTGIDLREVLGHRVHQRLVRGLAEPVSGVAFLADDPESGAFVCGDGALVRREHREADAAQRGESAAHYRYAQQFPQNTIPRNPAKYQCDEYPFNTTQQGAARGDGRFSVQRISGPDNEAAGTWLGAWYSYDRILDSDDFYVDATP